MPINTWVDKKNVLYLYSGLVSHKNEVQISLHISKGIVARVLNEYQIPQTLESLTWEGILFTYKSWIFVASIFVYLLCQ